MGARPRRRAWRPLAGPAGARPGRADGGCRHPPLRRGALGRALPRGAIRGRAAAGRRLPSGRGGGERSRRRGERPPMRERSPPPLPDGTRRPAAARPRIAPRGEPVPMRRDEEEDAGTRHRPAQGERQPGRPADARRAGAVELPPPDPPGGFGVHQAGFGPAPERRLPGAHGHATRGRRGIVPARSRSLRPAARCRIAPDRWREARSPAAPAHRPAGRPPRSVS